jgi:hypothetical protein
VPSVLAGSYELDASGSALLMKPPERVQRPTGETYLALHAVDLDDSQAILAFANNHAHLAGFEMDARYKDEALILRSDLDTATVESQRRTLREEAPAPSDVLDFEPLEEFRFAARILRDLTSAWLVVSGQADIASVTWCWTPYGGHGEARALLRSYLSPLLRGLHPRLDVDLAGGLEDGNWEAPFISMQEEHRRLACLFEVCAAELYNDIVAQTEYKTCANERCGRLFVLQHGRAVHGQHRTSGVKYCSPACARAQNQRNYRRRQAQPRQ